MVTAQAEAVAAVTSMRAGSLVILVLAFGLPCPAWADDRAEVGTSVFAEKRDGGKGGLTVVHPQADFGIDLGQYVTLDAGYSADAVSGATSGPVIVGSKLGS